MSAKKAFDMVELLLKALCAVFLFFKIKAFMCQIVHVLIKMTPNHLEYNLNYRSQGTVLMSHNIFLF